MKLHRILRLSHSDRLLRRLLDETFPSCPSRGRPNFVHKKSQDRAILDAILPGLEFE